ncbi:hypothetical protein P175DRAFT_0202463 [Aspergillus ochraceoroseus IBT 24754]|uniref:Alpha/beta hydrolase fold-3 domain-containing protein n=2 Tax=Aspergillus ochraceoroseus TaxID=138278 RepID=A0A2T5LZW6_9EURO|nr:uncharacterized protein P175DRAFT_0202463 [Aspergillus ochraceoroseus IBT 24754]KKK25610.1 hypothetical protein AOCH_003885 [Aspergillus ochraceoroseus]PTU21830.1 hypothetical protein P175DRAFT_0202463 [Aspergillus ochraceoroseus IBT 24754]
MSFFTYLYYKVVVTIIRFLAARGRRISTTPDEVQQIKSRDPTRSIKAHVYKPASASRPGPVLINFHGSGFVIPMHGSDDEFCRRVSEETEYTVLDIQYRLAPENPFPAALNDVEDVVNWVLQQPDTFDKARVALSGFSAGANLILAAASNLFSSETFNAVLAFYPPVDLYTQPEDKLCPDPTGKPIPPRMARFFDGCYIPSGHDTRDPRISPLYAQSDGFPKRVMVITTSQDNLAPEAEQLAAKIREEPGHQVIWERLEGCGHGWDKNPQNSIHREAKEKAYRMAIAMLN